MTAKTKETIFQISALLILFAAVFYNFRPDVARYVMIAAVAGFGISVFMNRYKGNDLRAKRLFTMQIFAVIIMGVSAYFMYMNMNEWVMFMLISALLLLYSSVVISRTKNKDNKKS